MSCVSGKCFAWCRRRLGLVPGGVGSSAVRLGAVRSGAVAVMVAGVLAVGMLCVGCARTIPQEQLVPIVVECLLLDRAIERSDSLQQLTSQYWVYEPVLAKHGYSVREAQRTFEAYIDKPERFRSLIGDVRTYIKDEQQRVNTLLGEEDARTRQYQLFVKRQIDSIPGLHGRVAHIAAMRLLSPDPARLPQWKCYEDSLYCPPPVRWEAVADTVRPPYGMPLYITRLQPAVARKDFPQSYSIPLTE